jgi:hypothetical protein
VRRALSAVVVMLGLANSAHGQAAPAKQIPGSSLVSDPFWGRPLTFADVFLTRLEDQLTASFSHWGENNGLYIPYEEKKPEANAYVSQTGRAVITIGVTGLALKKSPLEVCDFFLGQIDWALGRSFPDVARDNLLSHELPPSAGLTDQATRLRAYKALEGRTDLHFEYYQADTKQVYTCTRALDGTNLALKTQGLTD